MLSVKHDDFLLASNENTIFKFRVLLHSIKNIEVYSCYVTKFEMPKGCEYFSKPLHDFRFASQLYWVKRHKCLRGIRYGCEHVVWHHSVFTFTSITLFHTCAARPSHCSSVTFPLVEIMVFVFSFCPAVRIHNHTVLPSSHNSSYVYTNDSAYTNISAIVGENPSLSSHTVICASHTAANHRTPFGSLLVCPCRTSS